MSENKTLEISNKEKSIERPASNLYFIENIKGYHMGTGPEKFTTK